MKKIFLAVNGTLMRGLSLNHNLLDVGASFVRDTFTLPEYRLFSIEDEYPAMLRDFEEGSSIQVEIWELTPRALVEILQTEPSGLCLGRVTLEDHSTVFGVFGEPWICVNQREITAWKGWRSYIESKNDTK